MIKYSNMQLQSQWLQLTFLANRRVMVDFYAFYMHMNNFLGFKQSGIILNSRPNMLELWEKSTCRPSLVHRRDFACPVSCLIFNHDVFFYFLTIPIYSLEEAQQQFFFKITFSLKGRVQDFGIHIFRMEKSKEYDSKNV